MPDKVLIYSRFPKAMMVRIGQRFELMDAAGKPPNEMFTAEQLAGIRAMITAGGTPLGGDMMDMLPKLRRIVCYGTGYDGVDLAAAAQREDRGRQQSGGECGFGRRHRGDPDAGGDAAAAAGRQLRPQRKLVGGKTVAADAAAAGQSRPPHRRLRHGRDRPQDRGARRRRSRPRSAISAAAGTTCPIDICRASKRWRNGAAC